MTPLAAPLLCITLLAAATAAPLGAQQRVGIRGTSVTVELPAGFRVSREANARAIENATTGSTITFAEQPAAGYAQLAARFESPRSLSAGYAAQGVTIKSVRQVTTPGGPVPFAVGTQTSRGKDTVRFLALLKGDKTVLVTFNITDRSFTEADAETLLRTVEITPAPTIEAQLAALPFTFQVVEPFRVTTVRGRSSVTLSNSAARNDDDSAQRIVMVIGHGASQALMGDEPRLAVQLLRETSGLRDAEITAQEATPGGYRVAAVVEGRSIVQYLRILAGGSYLRLLARGETGAMDAAGPAIVAIADSLAQR